MCGFAETEQLEDIKNELLFLLEASHGRISCRQAVKLAAEKTGGKTRKASVFINRLVAAGWFRYVYEYGQSYLEKNFTGIIRLSESVMVAPPGLVVAIPQGMVMLQINAGAAFGDCRHPTTRLSVRAVDYVLSEGRTRRRALDIGTGSGILAITAAVMGVRRVLAIDIDACARKEARDNIALNRLEEGIEISDRPLEKTAGRFDLIMANLRPPTLVRYAELISEKTEPSGAAVLSGMKEEELDGLLTAYRKAFDAVWTRAEGGWCAAVLQRKEGKNGN